MVDSLSCRHLASPGLSIGEENALSRLGVCLVACTATAVENANLRVRHKALASCEPSREREATPDGQTMEGWLSLRHASEVQGAGLDLSAWAKSLPVLGLPAGRTPQIKFAPVGTATT